VVYIKVVSLKLTDLSTARSEVFSLPLKVRNFTFSYSYCNSSVVNV